ncbi:MAG: sigma-70 family RNA polymerase sigma factor [Myxococcota bacterium]|jgi:RNA polymerase sigma-70 factor (ECF subfamily)
MRPEQQTIEDADAALVARCQSGDLSAFDELVGRHQKRMLNVAYRMIGNYDEACDVVQEAFLGAYRSIGSFRRESRFTTWMCTIVMNHAKNRLQQRKARHSRECASIDAPIETGEGCMVRQIKSGADSALERMERQDIQKRVQDCIATLEREHREVLVLRDMQGHSYEEIMAMLKLPDGTVKSRLHRARSAMKDCLSDIIGELT